MNKYVKIVLVSLGIPTIAFGGVAGCAMLAMPKLPELPAKIELPAIPVTPIAIPQIAAPVAKARPVVRPKKRPAHKSQVSRKAPVRQPQAQSHCLFNVICPAEPRG